MPSPDKPKPKFPEIDQESLIPQKGGTLSSFARTVWVLMALIALAVVWLALTKFDIGRLRGADHYLEQARQAVAAKNWTAALGAIQKVEGEARTQPEFLRILADYLIGTRTDPETLAQLLEQLHVVGRSKPGDAIWLCMAHLTRGRPGPARAALERVSADLHGSLPYLDTRVALLKSEGRWREAVEAENMLFSRFANDPGIAVRKAARDLTGTFPEIQDAALKRLWQVAANNDQHALSAIRVLASYPQLGASHATRLQDLALLNPLATVEDRLNIASSLLRLEPERRDRLVQAEIARCRDSGPETFQTLIAWLAREREFEQILKLVPRDSLIKSAELFPAVAQHLAQREEWEDLMKLIEKGKPLPVSNARAASWRALATHNLRPADTRTARSHLEEAIAEGMAKNDRQALAAAIALAEEWNMIDLALEATLRLAIPNSSHEAELLEKCWQLASRIKREDVLTETAERLTKLKPGSILLARRLDYLRLLRGENIEVTAASFPAAPHPSDNELLLQALKAYRLGDLPYAASCIKKIESSADMTPGETAIYAGLLAKVLKATGLAYQVAERVQKDLLLPQEKTFLDIAL